MHIDRYPVDRASKYRFMLAAVRTGVVAERASYGWLLIRDADPPIFREATADEVSELPHLPGEWEDVLVDLG